MLERIAETGERFADFAPYVASIDERGAVAFQAALVSGGTGIFLAYGERMDAVERRGLAFTSHPDVNLGGVLVAYAERAADGEQAVLHGPAEALAPLVDTSGELARVGPLGPTMSPHGSVAFRADGRDGTSRVYAWKGDGPLEIARTPAFAAFHGLPVIDGAGRVIVRADLADGGEAIVAGTGGALETLVRTGDRFAALGRFPSTNEAGLVAFQARLTAGGEGIFTARGGAVETVIDTKAPFESFRGALIDDAGRVTFYATPRGGALGVYTARGDDVRRVIAIGDEAFGSIVTELALNPVSINARGDLALRLRLADGRQVIARALARVTPPG